MCLQRAWEVIAYRHIFIVKVNQISEIPKMLGLFNLWDRHLPIWVKWWALITLIWFFFKVIAGCRVSKCLQYLFIFIAKYQISHNEKALKACEFENLLNSPSWNISPSSPVICCLLWDENELQIKHLCFTLNKCFNSHFQKISEWL